MGIRLWGDLGGGGKARSLIMMYSMSFPSFLGVVKARSLVRGRINYFAVLITLSLLRKNSINAY